MSLKISIEDFAKLPMKYVLGQSFDNGARRLYVNEEYKFQKEVHTKRNVKTQEWGKGETYYFIDGDDTEYRNINDLYNALMKDKE